uniref:Uncharacterized protein n=1 Tax=Oryza nivara TaxID=4536 RepID=A0A0E0IS79_ORYNI
MEAPPPTQRGHGWSASPSPSLLALSPFSSVPSHGYARKAGEVWRRRISCTVRRAKLTICLEGNQTNKVFQTIWNEKPDGTVQRDIKIQKGSTIRVCRVTIFGWCLIHSKQTQILDNHGQVDDDEVIIDSPLLPYQISHDFLSQFGSSLPDLIDFNDVKPASFLWLFLS